MNTQQPTVNWKDRRAKDEYFEGSRRYKEKSTGLFVINVHAGDCYVTNKEDEVAATVLGSCISACIRDPIAGVGGMNHFLLPSGDHTQNSESMRFGAYAMEQLINEILKRGGRRERLEVKIFGGGNVIESSAMVGTRNARFAKDYLQMEEIAVASEDVGGTWPRKVRYFPVSGRAMVMKLKRSDDVSNVRSEEENFSKKITKRSDDAELF